MKYYLLITRKQSRYNLGLQCVTECLVPKCFFNNLRNARFVVNWDKSIYLHISNQSLDFHWCIHLRVIKVSLRPPHFGLSIQEFSLNKSQFAKPNRSKILHCLWLGWVKLTMTMSFTLKYVTQIPMSKKKCTKKV